MVVVEIFFFRFWILGFLEGGQGSTDGLEVTMSSEDLPLVWGYPILDVEKGPEGPIRQGNFVIIY